MNTPTSLRVTDHAEMLSRFLRANADHVNVDNFTSASASKWRMEVQFSGGIQPILFALDLDAFTDAHITVRSVAGSNGIRSAFHLAIEARHEGLPLVIVSVADADDPALDWAWFNGEPTDKDVLTVTAAYLREALNATEGA